MLQPDSMLPDVPRHPAPWNLRGSAWIIALKLPPGAPARDAFLPPGLARQGRGLASYLMYVDYAESKCGPYRELLFIPGAFRFAVGEQADLGGGAAHVEGDDFRQGAFGGNFGSKDRAPCRA